MANIVTGDQYYDLDGQLSEIKRQLRCKNGYPFDAEKLKRHLQDAIEGRFKVDPVGKFFMTVRLGQYPTNNALRDAIIKSGKKIGKYANQILDKTPISTIKQEIDLWEVTGSDLGFTKAVTRKNIYERAIELGFKICSAESIFLSRIQSDVKKWRVGGMEPITNSDGNLSILSLDFSVSGLCLGACFGHPDKLWDQVSVWLFARPWIK